MVQGRPWPGRRGPGAGRGLLLLLAAAGAAAGGRWGAAGQFLGLCPRGQYPAGGCVPSRIRMRRRSFFRSPPLRDHHHSAVVAQGCGAKLGKPG